MINFLTSHYLVSLTSLDVKFLFLWRPVTLPIFEHDALNSTRVGTGCHDSDDDRQECTNTYGRGVGHFGGRRVEGSDRRGFLPVDHRFNTGCIMSWVLLLYIAMLCVGKNFCRKSE